MVLAFQSHTRPGNCAIPRGPASVVSRHPDRHRDRHRYRDELIRPRRTRATADWSGLLGNLTFTPSQPVWIYQGDWSGLLGNLTLYAQSTSTVTSGRLEWTAPFRVQELCESRGGRPGLSVLMSLAVSVYVKQH